MTDWYDQLREKMRRAATWVDEPSYWDPFHSGSDRTPEMDGVEVDQ